MAINTNSLNIRYTGLDALARPVAGVAPVGVEAERKDVTADNSGNGQQRSRGFLRQQFESEDRALARLAPVRPTLSPSDEVALFGDNEIPDAASNNAPAGTALIAGEATDANGESVAVDIITPQTANIATQDEANVLPLVARQQYAVSQLYARNNDVTFSSSSVTLLAA